jgi:DNA-binding CsgD family transcriptional regulator
VDGAAPNPRAIATGIVTLLAGLTARNPVLVAIDDVQWLDRPSAHALDFAFRRLGAHPVAVLAARRLGVETRGTVLLESGGGDRTRALRIGPLSLAALYRIIEERLGRKLPRPLLGKIERACGGNPFFALEIARALPPSGSPVGGEALPIPADLSELVADRLRKLSRKTRNALLRASALAQPKIGVVDAGALTSAESAGLVRVDAYGRIEFAHPLYASAVYAAESYERRRRMHAELAEIAVDVEERARHRLLSRARDGEDEQVATALDDAAEHALRRGALEIAAEFDEQAARLTPATQVELRRKRQLRAARHHLKAGDHERSRALCEAVLACTPEAPLRVEALHLLAEAAQSERPADAIRLLEEARSCAGGDPIRSTELEVSLVLAHLTAMDLPGACRCGERALERAELAGPPALLAEAIAMLELARFVSGNALDERALERALELEDPDREVTFQRRVSFNVATVYEYAGRLDEARALLAAQRTLLAARGEEADLPWILCNLAVTSYLGGDLEGAEREASEAERAAALAGSEAFRAYALMVRARIRALRGDSGGSRADATETVALSERIGWPIGITNARSTLGMLLVFEGNPEAALEVLGPVIAVIERTGNYVWPLAAPLPDAIEALVATGDVERATALTDAFAAAGRRLDRPWALATSGRGEALLAAAGGHFDAALAAAERALAAHERLPMPFERARTLLVKGQVQRRSGERRAARATLEQAQALFQQLGTPLWTERAAAEIARIGVRHAPEDLTEGELRAAELAAQGLTNPEIAARLFMARRTVEANLARAYRKLEIRSRAELGAALAKRGPSSRA